MRVGVVILNVGGTMGHVSMVDDVLDPLGGNESVECVVITDAPAIASAAGGRPSVQAVLVESSAHQQSTAGCVAFTDVDGVLDALRQYGCVSVVFVTFFHRGLLERASAIGIRRILLTFPFREDHWRTFRQQRFDCLFDRVLVFGDLYASAPYIMNQMTVSYVPRGTVKWAERPRATPRALVLGGGGGRPSAIVTRRVAMDGVREYRRRGARLELHVSGGVLGVNNGCSNVDQHVRWRPRVNTWAADYDIVISEAGFCAVNELAATGVPTLLVPGVRRLDNQELRAFEFASKGAGACVLPQEGAGALADAIANVMDSSEVRARMNSASLQISRSLTRHPVLLSILNSDHSRDCALGERR